MNRYLRGAVLLAVTAALGACSTEPDQFADGTPAKIVAEPSAVFISRTDSQNVRIRVVDQQGTSIHQPISITAVGPGISVNADSAFRPIFRGDTLVFNPTTTELRVWVSTSALDNSSFTITSGDLTLEVPVVVTPNDAESFPFSTVTPALGEVVTVNVSSDLLFTDATKVVFGLDTLTPVSIAPEGTSLTFNTAPGLLGPATFTNVTLSYNKNIVFSVAAADTLNSPPGVQDFTFTNLTPAIGEQITITPPAGVVFSAETEVTFDSLGPTPHFTIAGDGSSMTLTAGPNSVGPTTFTNIVRPDNATFTFTLKSSDTLVAAGVDTFKTTVSTTAAAANAGITFTGATAAYGFDALNSVFTIGGERALIQSVAADSSSAVVLPKPGTSAGLTDLASPLVAGFLLGELPTDAPPITVTALAAPMAGTDAFATAPSITVPAIGETVGFWDGAPFGFTGGDFGNGERLYKFVVTAPTTFRFELAYISDNSDLGIAIYDNTFTAIDYIADNNGGDGVPEVGEFGLEAGTYYLDIAWFDYTTAASLYGLQITGLDTFVPEP